ncbi:Kanamycin B dioxygenase [Pseudocercospora fuligena]|uniref:Kanamycin B dioxygenase n=1 Tax=Pseudocercospora fuligena TaxID=685502 RepID=A0A8H6RAT6_9PEZI|nr:Kanamycin B dioxygenase [Pseudocercospora fuligena]
MASTLIRSRILLSSKRVQKFTVPLSRNASTLPLTIRPSRSEIENGRLEARNLESAVRSLHEDGLVVVSDVIPHKDLDHLNATMIEDARTLQSRGKDMPYNYNVGNIQQDPPPTSPYFHKSIFLNPIASQITTNVLGPRPKWTFCSGNTALPPLPGTEPQRQPVHADADFAHPTHPFGLVINVPLITFTPENGSTEVWLGTHTGELSGLHVQEGAHGERASGRIKEDLLEERRQTRGPSQPVIEKGSIVIRDLRLWHAGMPNLTQDIRVMLAMIHFAPWYRNTMKLELSEDVKSIVEEQVALEVPVNWISEQEASDRYLNRGFGNSYDFNQIP